MTGICAPLVLYQGFPEVVAAEVALLLQHGLPQLCSKLLILPWHSPTLSAKSRQCSIMLQCVPVTRVQCSSPPPASALAGSAPCENMQMTYIPQVMQDLGTDS